MRCEADRPRRGLARAPPAWLRNEARIEGGLVIVGSGSGSGSGDGDGDGDGDADSDDAWVRVDACEDGG
jgi:hypothetical protein